MWILLPVAFAGTPIIHDVDSPDVVLAQVARRTGLPIEQLDAIAFRDLIGGLPSTLGAAVIRHCAADPVEMTALRTELARAEGAWRQGDAQTAMDHLDLAVAWMSCLTVLAEPAPLARLFLLRGALLANADRMDDALDELNSALAFDPTLSWDPDFPAAGEALLSQARDSEIAHRISLTPPGSTSGPWLDGHLAEGREIAVRSGLHLIQVASTAGIRSAWLFVREDAALVIPTSYHRSDLARIQDPDRTDDLLTLLRGSFTNLAAAYVVHDGGLWLVTVDAEQALVAELEAPAVEAPVKKRKWWQFWKR